MFRLPLLSPLAKGLCILIVGVVAAERAPAGADPVESFFDDLQRPTQPAGGWQRYITDHLTNLGQLRRALEPREISLLSRYPAAFALVRTQLKNRLDELADDANADPISARAAAVLVGEMGQSANYRDLYGTVVFSRNELWPALERLAVNRNAAVRAAALRAIGSSRPRSLIALAKNQGAVGNLARQHIARLRSDKSPLRTTLLPVLMRNLTAGDVQDKRLAAQSLHGVMTAINDYWTRTTKRTPADFSDAEQNLRDAIVIANAGLQDADAQTRRHSLLALNRAVRFLKSQPFQLKDKEIAANLQRVINSTGFGDALVASDAKERWLGRKTLEYIADAYTSAQAIQPLPPIENPIPSSARVSRARRNLPSSARVSRARRNLPSSARVSRARRNHPSSARVSRARRNHRPQVYRSRPQTWRPSVSRRAGSGDPRTSGAGSGDPRTSVLRAGSGDPRTSGSGDPRTSESGDPRTSGSGDPRTPMLRPVLFQAADGPSEKLFQALARRAKETAQQLNDPNIGVRLAGIDFLEMMSEANVPPEFLRPIVGGLTARLQDGDPFVRWAAARTLGRIGRVRLEQPVAKGDPEKILEKVVKGLAQLVDPLREGDIDVRANAAKGLEKLARGAKAARPTVDEVVKIVAKHSYRELTLGAASGDAAPRLASLRALKVVVGGRKNDVLRDLAVYVTPQIVSQLQDADSEVRAAAAEALGSFGPGANAAVPALLQAMRDSNSAVRQAASDALLEIRQAK